MKPLIVFLPLVSNNHQALISYLDSSKPFMLLKDQCFNCIKLKLHSRFRGTMAGIQRSLCVQIPSCSLPSPLVLYAYLSLICRRGLAGNAKHCTRKGKPFWGGGGINTLHVPLWIPANINLLHFTLNEKTERNLAKSPQTYHLT